jgi:hypothetical protein
MTAVPKDLGRFRAGHAERVELPKTPTGISGLDEVTGGGLPAGRPTLVCGPAGCGKTLLALEFLVRGITEYDEPLGFKGSSQHPDLSGVLWQGVDDRGCLGRWSGSSGGRLPSG